MRRQVVAKAHRYRSGIQLVGTSAHDQVAREAAPQSHSRADTAIPHP